MKRKWIVILYYMMLCLSLGACGNISTDEETEKNTQVEKVNNELADRVDSEESTAIEITIEQDVETEIFDYKLREDGTVVISGLKEQGLSEIEIPEKIGGSVVTAIGSSAFAGNDDLVSVIIPNCVEEIGAAAFHRCKNLTKITLPNELKK